MPVNKAFQNISSAPHYYFDFSVLYMSFQDSEQRSFIYIKGCVPQFEKWLQDNLTVVAGIFIGIALLQVSSGVYSY